MKPNGNGKRPPFAAPAVQLVPATLTESLAIAIAFGNAASTYEVVRVRSIAGDQLPAGRYWYAGGQALDAAVATRVTDGMVALVRDHAGLPAEALYIRAAAVEPAIHRGVFENLPLADRMAYATFASSLAPLLTEVAAIDKRQAAAKLIADYRPPPARGMGERFDKRSPRLSDRVELSRRRDAAE